MAQTHKLIVVLSVRTQAAQRDGHAALQLPVQLGLGTVGLLKVVEELLGGGGEPSSCARPLKPTSRP